MRYAYYPGCSLSESAREYDVSTRAVLGRLDVELEEIPDWTCCGASAVESVSRLLSYTLPARNLCLAEASTPGADVLAPCSACYLNLRKVQEELRKDAKLKDAVRQVMAEEDLRVPETFTVRHLLDVLANDVGAESVAEAVSRPLAGMVFAPYYGCQILRPYRVFDDPERPTTMEPLIKALGGEVLPWHYGSRCCGASLMATKKDVALVSVAAILRAASEADAILTVCPMCQMNLEAYQKQAFRLSGQDKPVSVIYLPQVMGLAFGLSETEVLLGKNMVVTERFKEKLRHPAPAEALAEA